MVCIPIRLNDEIKAVLEMTKFDRIIDDDAMKNYLLDKFVINEDLSWIWVNEQIVSSKI
jgi:hypothetical protein